MDYLKDFLARDMTLLIYFNPMSLVVPTNFPKIQLWTRFSRFPGKFWDFYGFIDNLWEVEALNATFLHIFWPRKSSGTYEFSKKLFAAKIFPIFRKIVRFHSFIDYLQDLSA